MAEKSGPSWKFWATLMLGVLGTLLCALAVLYVKTVEDNFERQGKIIKEIAVRQEAQKKKIDRLGVKIFGLQWLGVSNNDRPKEVSPAILAKIKRADAERKKLIEKLKAFADKMKRVDRAVAAPLPPSTEPPRRVPVKRRCRTKRICYKKPGSKTRICKIRRICR